jgi:hypothetical protein
VWIAWLMGSALAGYGDPISGHPNWVDRGVHFWTNAARVAPEAWEADYALETRKVCTFDNFLDGEKIPKPGLLWHHDLGAAARYHSDDMVAHNYFSHNSIDGTLWSERIRSFYSGSAIGENIAMGNMSDRYVVLTGWMCSDGHRSNIMTSTFQEIGTGVNTNKHTQNFGGRSGLSPRAVASAHHIPQHPTTEVTIAADTWVDPADFVRADLRLDGVDYEMALYAGAEGRGIYAATVDTDSSCHTWYVEVHTVDGSVTRFPEDGSYGWGPCDWVDVPARWVDWQAVDEPEPEPEPGSGPDKPGDTTHGPDSDPDAPGGPGGPDDTLIEPGCKGCSSTATPSWLILATFGALALVRRRRSPIAR